MDVEELAKLIDEANNLRNRTRPGGGEVLGVPQDKVRAYMWFSLSAAQGREGAAAFRDLIARLYMTPAQIAEAQKLARERKPKHYTAQLEFNLKSYVANAINLSDKNFEVIMSHDFAMLCNDGMTD